VIPVFSAPEQAHRAGIICDGLVLLLVVVPAGMRAINREVMKS
jgi:hypothetical protein